MDIEKFTERSRGFIQSAQGLALRSNHQYFKPEQPAINLNVMLFMPIVWHRFFVQ